MTTTPDAAQQVRAVPTPDGTRTGASAGTRTPRRDRVLLIGLDAAEAELLRRGMDDGDLPALARLRERGAWGTVTSPPGFGSGAVWPSFATGVTPARHGRYFYRQVRPGSYEAQKFLPSQFHASPVWEAASAAGRRVAVFDVPKVGLSTGIDGVMAVDWISHGPVYGDGMHAWPPEFGDELVSRFGANPMWKCDMPGGRDADELKTFVELLRQRIGQRERCTRELWASGEFDLMVTVFADPHCAGHQSWHVRDAQHPMHDAKAMAELGDPVMDVYRAIDTAIGRILDDVDDDTTVIVFSGTGMGPNYSGNHLLDELLHRIERVPATRASAWTRRVKRAVKRHLPRELRRRGQPLKRRVEEAVASGDRSRRRAFAVPHNDIAGAVRLNVIGREQHGVVRPEDAAGVIDELRRELLALRNVDTGEPVVLDVVRVADHMQGEWLDHLPDAFVVWNRRAPIDRVSSDTVGLVELAHRGNRTGDHSPESLFLACGPGVEPGEVHGASIFDFAPTVAAVMGVSLPVTDGRALDRLVQAGRVDG